jgi:hypothetical protein
LSTLNIKEHLIINKIKQPVILLFPNQTTICFKKD